MRRIELDIHHIDTPQALQIYIQYCLNLPDWYGRNLDALYDVLTEMDWPTTIAITHGELSETMAAYLPRLKMVMEDAAGANDNLCVDWKD